VIEDETDLPAQARVRSGIVQPDAVVLNSDRTGCGKPSLHRFSSADRRTLDRPDDRKIAGFNFRGDIVEGFTGVPLRLINFVDI